MNEAYVPNRRVKIHFSLVTNHNRSTYFPKASSPLLPANSEVDSSLPYRIGMTLYPSAFCVHILYILKVTNLDLTAKLSLRTFAVWSAQKARKMPKDVWSWKPSEWNVYSTPFANVLSHFIKTMKQSSVFASTKCSKYTIYGFTDFAECVYN